MTHRCTFSLPRRAEGPRLLPSSPEPRRGTVLIVTLWIVFVLAGLVLVFARAMRVEALASANEVAAVQAAAVERGAEQYVRALVDQQKDLVLTMPEESFQAVQVGDGCFWIIRPSYGDRDLPSYGLVDEASKVNLNTASLAVLEALPGMNEDVAPALIDWRDADDSISAGGAESEHYLALPNSYYCKNAPLETVEELLLVRGCTKELLYGAASYQSSVSAGNPLSSGALPGSGGLFAPAPSRPSSPLTGILKSDSDWSLAHGLYDYVTVYSAQPNVSSTGQARVNINDDNQQPLLDILRQTIGAARASALAPRLRPRPPFRNIFDFYARSGLTLQEFQQIADRLSTSAEPILRGLININTAPREVLLCLPGIDENDVANIVSRRSGANADLTGIAWLAEAMPQKAMLIGNLITARAYQYSADILAVSGDGRAFKRCRIVVDSRTSPPRVVYRKDLTSQGWPLEQQILTSLRSGMFVGSTSVSASGGAR
jgi:type II secretory pathway component PulK